MVQQQLDCVLTLKRRHGAVGLAEQVAARKGIRQNKAKTFLWARKHTPIGDWKKVLWKKY